ncbi:MAG: endonuclease III [Myxococcales bacterium]|nr:endonuclease III [Myxococcales bacterium]
MKAGIDVSTILSRLRDKYPTASYELNWETPTQMLVATILAAQCTDERVNAVTATLFVTYPDARAFAQADLSELEQAIKPTGFFRQKAKTVQAVCQALEERFGGEVPASLDELITLPGVARKTANVVLATCWDRAEGVIVDTHVVRLAKRMGLSDEKKPEAIERDLMELVPQSEWTYFGPAVILHGRYTCVAKGPKCSGCMFDDVCPKVGVK